VANEGAWNQGWSIGAGLAQEQRARKQALTDEARKSHLGELQQNIGTLQQKYSSLLGSKGEETPESLKAKYALSQALQQKDAILNPQQKPGVVGKIGQKIGEALHLAKKPEAQSTTMQPAEITTPTTEPGITLAATQEYKIPVASAPAEATKPVALPATQAGSAAALPKNRYANPEDQPPEVSFSFNKQFAKPGPYVTKLSPQQEQQFQAWAQQHPDLVKGELDTPMPDYDVRGRWLADQRGDPAAKLVKSAFDGKLHANDKWKTPYDATFSNESIYAKPNAPRWRGDKLVAANGTLLVDETPKSTKEQRAQALAQGAAKPIAGEQPRRITSATEPGLPATTLTPTEAVAPAIQFGRPTTVKGPALTPAQLRAQAQTNQRIQRETDLLTAAAPISPQQQAIQQAQAGTAGMMETIRGKLDTIKAFHPDATPEELQKLNDTYLDTVLGTVTKSKPLTGSKPYKGADGKYYQSMQNTLTNEITAEPMPADYTPPAARPLSPGAQYMQALVKRSEGQPLNPEEEAALKSYPEYVRQTSVIPGVARMVAGAQARPMVVVNPDNPQQTMIASAGQAERGKYATTASVGYQVNVAGHKALIPKGLGSNIAALATAEDHLKMANGLVDALGTGNVVALNRLSLMWSQATGDPAPTDFETVKTSLEGEMARAFTGVGATQGEIASVGSIINKANSPQALKSALNYARLTMEARRKNLWATAEQAGLTAPAGAGAPPPVRVGSKTYKQTATGPNGHKIGSNDGGNTWVDVQTGKAVR
jgi:hypothetical protein